MQVLTFCPDAQDLAVITDRWRQAPPRWDAGDRTPHASAVSVARALQRSGAPIHLIRQAAKLERLSRPQPVLCRTHELNRRKVRLYRSRLLESDVTDILDRWAKRQRWARWQQRRPPTAIGFARYMQQRLATTHLRVSLQTILDVMSGNTWHGMGA